MANEQNPLYLQFKLKLSVYIRWKDVWAGAIFTAILFAVGKYLIGLYIGNSNITSTFGTAGALAALLVWVYYSAQLVIIGAEFTQVWVRRSGRIIPPDEEAVKVREDRWTEEDQSRSRVTKRPAG